MNTKDVVLVAASTFLITIGAYIALPIGPVPIVLTNFFIVLIALLLGWKKALIAIVTYLIIGSIGLPVFSNGKGGIGHLLGLTGGFLIGFIPLALFAGFAKGKSIISKLILVISGSILLYVIGLPWAQWVYNNVVINGTTKSPWNFSTTMKYCATPFLIPDLIKGILAITFSELLKKPLKPYLEGSDE